MSESVDSVIEGFPCSTITKHTGELNYKTIKDVEHKLIKNVSSCPSKLGGGNYGYLGLILIPEKHALVAGNNFIPHPNLGSLPAFPANLTQPQIAQVSTTHVCSVNNMH